MKIGALLFVACIVATAAGCKTYEVITQMDLPTAPTDLLWKKDGVSTNEKDADMRGCSEGFERRYEEIGARAFDGFDLCMLKNGYKYMPRGINGGYQNICLKDADGAACRSVRGQ